MQSLATVLDDVREGRRPPWPCRPIPHTFRFRKSPSGPLDLCEISAFGSNPGNLRMIKAVPERLRSRAPLVVLLHGCGQTARDIDHGSGWSTLAGERGFALLLPEQRRSNNAQRGFNWFRPGDIARDSGEALSIRQMIQRMIEDHDLDEKRLFVTGLSAGGAMTSALLALYPEVFAGGAIVAGLPFGVASNLWGALAAMKGDVSKSPDELGNKVRAASEHRGRWPKLSVWHGNSDKTVVPSNADAIARQWCNVHGLSEDAAAKTQIAGHTRFLWRSPSGAPIMEKFVIEDLGHASPLALESSKRAYGSAAPFFEEAGISSTYHIAKFWGLLSPRIGFGT